VADSQFALEGNLDLMVLEELEVLKELLMKAQG
jgi:hypothetical protein